MSKLEEARAKVTALLNTGMHLNGAKAAAWEFEQAVRETAIKAAAEVCSERAAILDDPAAQAGLSILGREMADAHSGCAKLLELKILALLDTEGGGDE